MSNDDVPPAIKLGKVNKPWHKGPVIENLRDPVTGKIPVGKGRPKGSSNKAKWMINQAVLNACDNAGGKGGAEAFLTWAARKYPAAFLSLLAKTMTLQVNGDQTSGRRIVVQIVQAEYAAPAEGFSKHEGSRHDKPKLIDAQVVDDAGNGDGRNGGG